MSFGSFKNNVTYKLIICKSYIYLICIYQQDLALNNQQGLIYSKTHENTYKKQI